jgi:hypothetical protein
MPTLYIKQLKQHTPKGNSWKWGRKLYGQVRKLSPIYSLNLFFRICIRRLSDADFWNRLYKNAQAEPVIGTCVKRTG